MVPNGRIYNEKEDRKSSIYCQGQELQVAARKGLRVQLSFYTIRARPDVSRRSAFALGNQSTKEKQVENRTSIVLVPRQNFPT